MALSFITAGSASIDPSQFAGDKQGIAQRAKDADQDHKVRIKGTSDQHSINNSFFDSVKSWNPEKNKDTVSLGGHRSAPDGGMRELARLYGRP